MNCAWCGANADGSDSHGICDSCMQRFFGVDPEGIHTEMEEAEDQTPDTADEFNSWRPQR